MPLIPQIESKGESCTFPTNAVPSCTSQESVCSFSCENGYVPTANLLTGEQFCGCFPPYAECGGVCSSACPSAGVEIQKRDMKKRTNRVCPKGYTACGLYEWRGQNQPWDCVDTMHDLESCEYPTVAHGPRVYA